MVASLSTGLWRLNDRNELDVHLHHGQARALQSTARFVTILAGTQGGKTSLGPLWLYREIRDRGPGDYLVAALRYIGAHLNANDGPSRIDPIGLDA